MATDITAITAGTPALKVDAKPKAFAHQFKIYTAQCTLTDATIPAQGGASVSVTVPGVALGDFALVSYPAALAGIILVARVIAADTVEVVSFNREGTDAVTAMSGGLTANIVVLRPLFNYT